MIARLLLEFAAAGAALLPPPAVDRRLPPYHTCELTGGSLTGSATDITADLVERWRASFSHFQPGITIAIDQPTGPPQATLNPGLRAFLEGRRDFAIVSRDLSDADFAAFASAHGHAPLKLAVAGGSWRSFGILDPVVFIVNDANPLRRVTLRQLAALLAHDRLEGAARPADWGAMGVATWRGRGIHLVGGGAWRGPYSARTQIVRDRILLSEAKQNRLRDDLDTGNESDVPAAVAGDALAIGFTGLGHVMPGTHVLALSVGSKPAISPTFRNVAHGRYMLARTVNLYFADASSTAPLRAWIAYLRSREGQNVVLATPAFLPITRPSGGDNAVLRPAC